MASHYRRLICACIYLMLVCSGAARAADAPLVLAASSLQESLTAAANIWAASGNPRPVLSFAASSVLARQVEAGAPADLFIAADEQWMDYLDSKRLLAPRSRVALLSNRLALIAPRTSKVSLPIRSGFPLAQALGNGRLAMADPDAVPAGKYGKAALVHLKVWAHVSRQLVRADSARAALALVERGEAPLGIVYITDARASARVRIVGIFPANSHMPIIYPIARLASSRNREAEAFRRFLISHAGKAIFARHGFMAR